MPAPIETRPFTLHAETFAWPSFRIYNERAVWLYVVVAIAIGFLFQAGLQTGYVVAALLGIGLTAAFVGLSFGRYKNVLRKPANQQIYRDSVVKLTDEEVRQDFADGSFMEIKLFALKTFRDMGDYYFVFADRRNGIVVQKTAFESPEQSNEFAERMRAAVRKRVGPRDSDRASPTSEMSPPSSFPDARSESRGPTGAPPS